MKNWRKRGTIAYDIISLLWRGLRVFPKTTWPSGFKKNGISRKKRETIKEKIVEYFSIIMIEKEKLDKEFDKTK